MKKNLIALMMSIVMVVGSIGGSSVFAAETTAQEASEIAQEEETVETEDGDAGLTAEVVPEEETFISEKQEPDKAAEETVDVEEIAGEQDKSVYSGNASAEIAESEIPSVIDEDVVIEEGKEAELAENMLDSGTCGENATWMLTGTEHELTLTISGSGKMDDYDGIDNPWGSRSKKIKTVIVEKGITSIGEYAFYTCESLTSITIPDSVTNRLSELKAD